MAKRVKELAFIDPNEMLQAWTEDYGQPNNGEMAVMNWVCEKFGTSAVGTGEQGLDRKEYPFKRVYQTKFGKPEGNCFGACVASILGLNEIPVITGKYWWDDFRKFIFEYGYDALFFTPNALQQFLNENIPDSMSIASGVGDRGINHSVVFKGKELLHDPFPDGNGIKEPTSFIFLIPHFYTKLSPARSEVDEKKVTFNPMTKGNIKRKD